MRADGYLRGVLADGAEPFRHRGRVRTLLGLPEDAGTPIGFTRAPGMAAFEYLRERRHRPSAPMAPAVVHSVDLGGDPGGAMAPGTWPDAASEYSPTPVIAPRATTADARAGEPADAVVEVAFPVVRRPERGDAGAEPTRVTRPGVARERGDSGADDGHQAVVRQGVDPDRERHGVTAVIRSSSATRIQGAAKPAAVPTVPEPASPEEPRVRTSAPSVSAWRVDESTQDSFGSAAVRDRGAKPVETAEPDRAVITPANPEQRAGGRSAPRDVRPVVVPGGPVSISEVVTVTGRPAPGRPVDGQWFDARADDVVPRPPEDVVIESPAPARRSAQRMSSVDTEVWVGDGNPFSTPTPRYRREKSSPSVAEQPAPPQEQPQSQARVVVVREETRPTQAFWERRHLGRLWVGVPR